MIRPARADDLRWLREMERDLFDIDAWSEDLLHARVSNTLVAEEFSGYVVITQAGDFADLERIGVAVNARRQRLASRLLAAAQQTLPPDVDRILVEVRADNAPALAFYGAHGFTEISRRPAYYADGTDARVMARKVSTIR